MPEQVQLGAFVDGPTPTTAASTCPTCGRGFDTEQGLKIHHARAHGESIAGVEVECEQCGETVRKEPWQVEQRDHHFCSRECHGVFQVSLVAVKCDYCGEEVQKQPHQLENNDHHFCSRECMGAWRSEHKAGENAAAWRGGNVEVACAQCGETMRKKPADAEQYDHHFCSLECKGAWQSDHKTGENAPRWRGGSPNHYGPSWRRQRRAALSRADAACELCGLTREQHRTLHGRDLEVHHKVPFRVFGVEHHAQANALSNLVVVCRSCHHQIEPVSQRRAPAGGDA